MSIHQRLRELEKANPPVVERFVPATRSPPKRRAFLMGQARSEFNSPSSAVNTLVGKGLIYNSLVRWTSGGLVHGNKRRGLFVNSLDAPPPDIWEIRVTEPRVQARFIGCFAEKDTLVLMRLHTRNYLGKKGSLAWSSAMAACVTDWSAHFSQYAMHHAHSIHDYVSENCDDFPV